MKSSELKRENFKTEDDFYTEKLRLLEIEIREYWLHISIIKLFNQQDLWWFLHYNIQAPESYIITSYETVFPSITTPLTFNKEYKEMTIDQKRGLVLETMHRNSLYS